MGSSIRSWNIATCFAVVAAASALFACSSESDGGGATTTGGTGASGSASTVGGGASPGGSGAGASSGTAGGGGDHPIAPQGEWFNATGNLAGMDSECGNLGLVVADPRSSLVLAGVAQKGLWATHDAGLTWESLGTGAGSAEITNRISAIVWDPDHPGTFWESGIYNGGGVYKTTDYGEAFQQVGDINHNDSVSVDLSDPDRKTMLAGPHEASQKLFRSTDGGASWTDIGASLPGGAGFCTATLVLDASTFLVGCTGDGIFRSTNGGESWTKVADGGVWPQPLLASDASIYWSGTQGGIHKSTDHGASFGDVADSSVSVGVVAPTTIAELPDGRIVTVGPDHLQMSADGGTTWAPVGDPLPIKGGGFDGAAGVTYSAEMKAFFIWHWTCGEVVPDDAIMGFGFDDQTE